ncbi:MAG: protein-glutamate O-methyltransferase CheR [Magnetococcales bacterium]|nr:protein-glutamate O-methyltransferase CheR [Magnetococcales bacterium]
MSGPTAEESWSADDLARWQALVREQSGLFFDQNRISKLREGIEDRQLACGITSRKAYWQRVQEDAAEFAALLSLLTVNETYFFRGIEELRLFCDDLLPAYRQQQAAERTVNVVSAGCASGEEAYSLAILLLERHGEECGFGVRGGDVDGRALQLAAGGVYGEYAFRNCDPCLRQRYFTREVGGRERVIDALRRRVHFFPLNLMSAIYPDPMQGVDFIFYRNVSIYFDAATKRAVFNRLLDQLAPGGCLFLSPAEIFFHNQPQVRPGNVHLESWQGRFFFRKRAGRSVVAAVAWEGENRRDGQPVAMPPGQQPAGTTRSRAFEVAQDLLMAGEKGQAKQDRQKQMAKVIRLVLAGALEEALQLLLKRLWSDPPHPQVATLRAAILLCLTEDRQALRQAVELCRAVIKRDALCFEGLLLLAMGLHQEGGDPIEQIAHLRAAVFLRPDSWLPHYYLALAYELLQEMAMAVREYQIVICRLKQSDGVQRHGLPFLPLPLTVQELVDGCQNRLQQIKPE